MFNKKYKKGMADAAKAYEAFGKKQEDALKHILEEVRQGKRDLESVLRELNGNIDGLYDYIDSKEKAHLYSVYTPFDIINLNKNDRLFLVGVLCRLTVDKAPNENQQNYIRAVQKYLDVKEPPFGIDPMYIETIEDIPTQKAILQTVLEYLCLQDGDSYDETEYQQEFLDAFSVNAKGRKEIMDHIDLLYTATGAKGLAEKYGYVPEEEEADTQGFGGEKNGQRDFVDLADDIKDKIAACQYGRLIQSAIETEHFILAEPDGYARTTFSTVKNTICVNKVSGEIEELSNYQCVNRPKKMLKLETEPDTIITWYEPEIRDAHIGIFNLETKQYTEIDNGHCMELLCAKDHYIVYFQETTRGSAPNKLFIYDTLTSKTRIVSDPPQDAHYGNLAEISEGNLYFTGWNSLNSWILYKVALSGNLVPEVVCSIGTLYSRYVAMKIMGTGLFLFEENDSHNLFVYHGDLAELNNTYTPDKEDNPANNKFNFVGLGLSALLNENSKNHLPSLKKTCVVGESEHISAMVIYDDILLYGDKECGCIETFKWDTGEISCLVQGGAYCNNYGFDDTASFIRLGNWIYFRKGEGEIWSSETYKVNLDAPLQVEKVKT